MLQDDQVRRREWLQRQGAGLGSLALSTLLSKEVQATGSLSGKTQHHPARATSVIWLFMNGGPSGIDLLDHKPALERYAGQPFPGELKTLFPYPGPIMPSPFKFRRYGECGAAVSQVLPHLAHQVDKLTFLQACVSEEQNHVPACYMMNTGSRQMGSPALGSWASYGLGRESNDLPDFVVMYDHRSSPEGGASLWGSGFLPGQYQGVTLRPKKSPILYIDRPGDLSQSTQHAQQRLLKSLNRQHAQQHPFSSELEARIRSFETAYQMQASVPNLVDLSSETQATYELYGLNDPTTRHFGSQCLLARRMVEQNVPFIQIYHGGYENNWDQHGGLAEGHAKNCMETDRPMAGLLLDLEQRGLLDSTLVIWGGEFGRGPTAQDRDGRDHNPYGFTMWLAGGGVKRGFTLGATDEFGYLPVEHPVSMHDLHATVLHLMGLDESRLTFRSAGRDQSATNGLGHVLHPILA
ncbi:MAG: DUF1501 domain-containing protein [Pirellulaceae bacterium]|nr:DUF1501 domain-containing protein [Pirellulaceae bacterium]